MSQLKNKYLADDAVTARNITDEVISNIHISPLAAIEYSKLDLTGSITPFDFAASVGLNYVKVGGNMLGGPLSIGTLDNNPLSFIVNGATKLTVRETDHMLELATAVNIEKVTGILSIATLAGDLSVSAVGDLSISGTISLSITGATSSIQVDADILSTTSSFSVVASSDFGFTVNGNMTLQCSTLGSLTLGYMGFTGAHAINGNTLSLTATGGSGQSSVNSALTYSSSFAAAIGGSTKATLAAVGVAGAFNDASLVNDAVLAATGGRLILSTDSGRVDIMSNAGSVTVGDILVASQAHRINGSLLHYSYDGTNTQGSDKVLSRFPGANNVVTPTDVTGLSGSGSEAFHALVKVTVDATVDLYESFVLHAVKKGSTWELTDTGVGDDSGVIFSITSAGQIQYTSSSYTGFVSLTISWVNERLL